MPFIKYSIDDTYFNRMGSIPMRLETPANGIRADSCSITMNPQNPGSTTCSESVYSQWGGGRTPVLTTSGLLAFNDGLEDVGDPYDGSGNGVDAPYYDPTFTPYSGNEAPTPVTKKLASFGIYGPGGSCGHGFSSTSQLVYDNGSTTPAEIRHKRIAETITCWISAGTNAVTEIEYFHSIQLSYTLVLFDGTPASYNEWLSVTTNWRKSGILSTDDPLITHDLTLHANTYEQQDQFATTSDFRTFTDIADAPSAVTVQIQSLAL